MMHSAYGTVTVTVKVKVTNNRHITKEEVRSVMIAVRREVAAASYQF